MPTANTLLASRCATHLAADEHAASSSARPDDLATQIRDPWVGARQLLPDGIPLIDRLSADSNVSVATGHGMLGVALRPATARRSRITSGLRGARPPSRRSPLIAADGRQQPHDEEAHRGVRETEAESANRCGSEVEYQVAVGLGAADERLVASGHFQGVGGVGDVPGQDWRDAGVADAGSAGPSGGDVAGVGQFE